MGKRSIGLIRILGPQGHNRKALGMGLLVASIAVSILVGACMDVQVRMGRRTDPGALDKTLRIKKSTSTEVLAALGEPFGKGKALLPIAHQTPRTM